MTPKRNIYAIYADQDKDLAHNLIRHFQLMEKDYNVSIWHDRPIFPDQEWKPQNTSRFNQAHIVLFLVSNAFMYSKFIEQNEFKMVIDSYKDGKVTVVPILLDSCPWDIEFNADDYDFSFKELQVLPENRKPISDWSSTDEALAHVTGHVKRIVSPTIEHDDLEVPDENLEEKTKNTLQEDQITLNFAEEAEAKKKTEEELKLKEEAQSKKKAEQEKRVVEAAESEKRALEEKRFKEEAEAKRKAEQELIEKEEAKARKMAFEEKRPKEEEEAQRKVEQEQKQNEEAQAKKRAEEEKRVAEVAEANNRALEKKRLKEEEGAQIKAEQELKGGKGTQVKKRVQEVNRREEQVDRTNTGAKATRRERLEKIMKGNQDERVEETENRPSRKKVYIGLGIGTLVVAGILVFSLLGKGSENELPAAPQTNTPANTDSTLRREPKDGVLREDRPVSKIVVGNTHAGGLVFSVGPSGTSGKIAYPEDSERMPWEQANAIHEQLGEGWRLPTLDELQQMRRTIGQGATNSGEFSDGLYWSATPYDDYQARLLRFRDGNTSYHYNKVAEHRKFRVRAVRDF